MSNDESLIDCLFLVVVCLLLLVFTQMIFSLAISNDEQDEMKFEDERDLSTSTAKQGGNVPDCLSKNVLYKLISRNRRASISRPYFHHWRGSRDNSRYTSKNLLPFSPRLGKRAADDENDSENELNKRQFDDEINSPDFDTFLAILMSYLQRKNIDILSEDASQICLSEPINSWAIRNIWEQFESHRRAQEEQEARERHSKSKHPFLFRYRLG